MNRDRIICTGCVEYQQWTRRRFLEQSRHALAPFLPSAVSLPKVTLKGDEDSRDTLLMVFLRGAMDGLTTIVPYGDPNYYSPSLRPDLAIDPPGNPNGAVDLDGFFGLAPAMASLLPAYQAADLAVVHATGSPDPTRSHFDAFQYMEYGTPLQPLDLFTGWLGRHLALTPAITNTPLRAVAVANILPKTLAGAPKSLPVADPSSFGFPGRPQTEADRRAVLETTYADANESLASAAQSTLDTIDLLTAIDFDNYIPSNGAVYPGTGFGTAVRSVAAMIQAEIGLEVGMVELGGWDTHANQNGQINNLMTELSNTLAAFHLDMQTKMNRLVVLVMSEFGRRADQNGSNGTDHGHGNCMLVMGGNISGGQVFTDWTSGELLHPDLLFQGDSLEVTTDYRDIVAEVLQNRLETADLSAVFPNYTPTFQGITL